MPMFQGVLEQLNRKFDSDQIKETAKGADAFAPGRPLNIGFLVKKGTARYKTFQGYLDKFPGSLQEALRSAIYYALTSKPAKTLSFSWRPAYDFEVSVQEFGCGITIHISGRYPSDAQPDRSDGTG